MNVWNCLPHRMLINKSLHKESDELRLKIDAYQVEYDRRVEKCKTELEQEEMKRNRELDKFKDSLNLKLQDDQALLNEIYEDVTGYVDKYLYSKYIDKFLEAKKNLYKLLQEDCNFLSEQMKDISDEIEILRGRKQVLTSFTDVRDVIDLMTLSGYEIQTDCVVDAPTLIKYINSTLENSEEKQETERYSLRRLKNIVQQRADYVSVIQYIDWVIQQKKLFGKQLSAKRNIMRKTMSELSVEIEKMGAEKMALKHNLAILAERVRMHWARPITYLSADICYYKNERDKAQREIDYMQSSREPNDDWDNEWNRKKLAQAKITAAYNKRKEWNRRKAKICELIKTCNTHFSYGRKISVIDEQKIINFRLNEIAIIREDGKKEAELTCQKEKSRIDKKHAEAINAIESRRADLLEKLNFLEADYSRIARKVQNAQANLKRCQDADNRVFFLKWFSKTSEVISARQNLKKAMNSLGGIKEKQSKCKKDIEQVKLDQDVENKKYNREVRFCVPRLLRPTVEEKLEEKKLLLRKQDLVAQQNQEV